MGGMVQQQRRRVGEHELHVGDGDGLLRWYQLFQHPARGVGGVLHPGDGEIPEPLPVAARVPAVQQYWPVVHQLAPNGHEPV